MIYGLLGIQQFGRDSQEPCIHLLHQKLTLIRLLFFNEKRGLELDSIRVKIEYFLTFVHIYTYLLSFICTKQEKM